MGIAASTIRCTGSHSGLLELQGPLAFCKPACVPCILVLIVRVVEKNTEVGSMHVADDPSTSQQQLALKSGTASTPSPVNKDTPTLTNSTTPLGARGLVGFRRQS